MRYNYLYKHDEKILVVENIFVNEESKTVSCEFKCTSRARELVEKML